MFKNSICLAAVVLVFGWGSSFALGQENLIQNGEFDDGLNGWGLYGGGTGFTASVVQDAALSGYNAALIDVTNAGATTSIGIAQSVQCEKGKTYKIGVTARASQPRELVILFQLYTPTPSWADVFTVRVPLTTKAQTFVYEYTHTRETTSANTGWAVDVYYMLKGPYWSMSGSDLNCKVWLDRIYIGQESPVQHRYRASGPQPVDGEVIEKTSYGLRWTPGDFAASHTVYFSDSFDDVNEANVAGVTTARADMSAGVPGGLCPEGLVPGTTYYWRVDEVNDAHPDSPWKGDVWSFLVPPRAAWQPTPIDEAELVAPEQDLAWNKGLGALFHMIHLGEVFDDVNDAATDEGMVSRDPAYDPGAMEAGTTYFWRVDTFDGFAWHKGPVWSFTTVPDVAITDPDLAGWWTLDEGRGTTAIDWSGYGGHGIVIGGPQWSDGIYGGALAFSGIGQYVNCGTAAADITGDFTLAAWVKMVPANSGRYMGIAGRLNTVYQGFALVRHSSDLFRLWVGDGSADLAKSAVNSDMTYTDIEWHHIAMVHEGQVNRLFVDGKQQAGTSDVTLAPNPEFFHIGRQYSNSNDRYFNGLIDDVRIYRKAMTEQQIHEVLAGDPLVASSPAPGVGAVVDIRDADALRWSKGAAAVSHDVYFGTDREAVAEANNNSPEFKGNRPGTSFPLADLVAFGGGDYYWRIDEIETGGQLHKGYVWKFTVPAYLIVDDFEGYSDDTETYDAVFQTWLDGYGYTQPVQVAGNGTGSTVGYPEPRGGTFCEAVIVNPGGSGQSMPFEYDNADFAYSETSRTWSTPQDWTVEGVSALVLHVRGAADNDTSQPLYVALANQGKTPVVVNLDTSALSSADWTEQKIPLSRFTGVNPGAIKTMHIGVGDRNSPKPGGRGILYIDDIRLVRP